MQTLYATTALALMFGLTTTVYGAGTLMFGLTTTVYGAGTQSEQQPEQQQAGQSQQQSAQGQQQGEQMQRLGSIDANNDGRISAEEAQAHRERIFSSLDANSDSKLSRNETAGLVAIEPGYVAVTRMVPVTVTADVGEQMLAQMDQDQNQRISRQEYMQYGEQQFKEAQERAGGELRTGGRTGQQAQAQSGQQAQSEQQRRSGQQTGDVVRWREANVDRNGDGIVSADEAAAAWVETFQQLDRNADDQLSRDELEQMQAQKAMIDRRFAKLDANGDGQISLDEYSSAGHDLMVFADLNRDGDVTAWEYRAVRVTDR